MLAHLGGEDHVDDDRPQCPVLVAAQILEYVRVVVLSRELKCQRSMVILQNGSIITN
jgi:hypothetical protein